MGVAMKILHAMELFFRAMLIVCIAGLLSYKLGEHLAGVVRQADAAMRGGGYEEATRNGP